MKSYIRIVENPNRILRTYSSLSLIANILIALSFIGFSLAGVEGISMATMITCILFFSVLGLIGRFIKEDLDNLMTKDDNLIIVPALSVRFVHYIEDKINNLKKQIKELF